MASSAKKFRSGGAIFKDNGAVSPSTKPISSENGKVPLAFNIIENCWYMIKYELSEKVKLKYHYFKGDSTDMTIMRNVFKRFRKQAYTDAHKRIIRMY